MTLQEVLEKMTLYEVLEENDGMHEERMESQVDGSKKQQQGRSREGDAGAGGEGRKLVGKQIDFS